jgi:hypothetical protein
VGEPEQKSSGVLDVGEQLWARDEFEKQLLQPVSRVRFPTSEIQQKSKQRRSVFVIELAQIGRHDFGRKTRHAQRFV